MKKRLLIRTLVALILLFSAWRALPQVAGDPSGGEGTLAAAWEDGASGVWVEGEGTVVRVLDDDRQGSPHQRFILSVSEGHTLLISHNIDLAPRVEPLRVGDAVEFRGRYEWNPQGGVVHWTHHDPDGRLPGGWLESGGSRVR